MDGDLWKEFSQVFSGYSQAYGKFSTGRVDERGKTTGRAETVRGEPTEQLWRSHLDGAGVGLGVIALRDDNTVKFAAIDIDKYNIDHTALEKKIAKFKLPLIVCRSKSGGAHCYLFAKEPIDAQLVRDKLASWASILGFGGVEVFPKQSYRARAEDIGNWINLPYYNASKGNRFAIKEGNGQSLRSFLDMVKERQVTAEQFSAIKDPVAEAETDDKEGHFTGAPPCLKFFLVNGGIPEGMRNEGMFNVACYLRKRFPDNWQDMVPRYNDLVCSPPLKLNEINTLVKSVERKDYELKCNGPHCNKKKCRSCEFGLGDTAHDGDRPDITSITKYDGDPVLWGLDVEGVRIMCDSETLLSQQGFNKLCMEKINRVPGTISKSKWEKYIDSLLKNADTVPVPEDASPAGMFINLFETFCTVTNRQAKVLDEVLQNKPFRDKAEGVIYFKAQALFEFLDERKFKYKTPHQIWTWVRELCGGEHKKKRIKGKQVWVWSIKDSFEDVQQNEELRSNVPKVEF